MYKRELVIKNEGYLYNEVFDLMYRMSLTWISLLGQIFFIYLCNLRKQLKCSDRYSRVCVGVDFFVLQNSLYNYYSN